MLELILLEAMFEMPSENMSSATCLHVTKKMVDRELGIVGLPAVVDNVEVSL
jgi:hypothetical protein